MRRETRYVSEAAWPTSSRNDEDCRLRVPGLGDDDAADCTGDAERRRRPAESLRASSAPASSTEGRIANCELRWRRRGSAAGGCAAVGRFEFSFGLARGGWVGGAAVERSGAGRGRCCERRRRARWWWGLNRGRAGGEAEAESECVHDERDASRVRARRARNTWRAQTQALCVVASGIRIRPARAMLGRQAG